MKEHAKIVLIGFGLGLLIAMIQGCNLRDIIKTNTPIAIQKSQGLPSKITLNQARGEYDSWRSDVQRTDAEWRQSIAGGEEALGLIEGFGMSALQAYSPLAGPLSAPLLLFGGYFFGNGGKRKQEQKSYNAGIKIGRDIVASLPDGAKA